MHTEARTKADVLSGVEKPVEKSKKLSGRSTVKIWYQDGTEAIRYHDTDVITFDGDLIILDSGGFRTVTTKSRINEYTNLSVWSEQGIWYVRSKSSSRELFYDGIIFDSNGNLVSESQTPDKDRIKDVKKQISKFVKLLDDMPTIPMPDGGDCWVCMFGQTSCLESHLEEGYLHGTLIYKALEAKGYKDPAFIMHYGHRESIKSALRVYLKKALLPELQNDR